MFKGLFKKLKTNKNIVYYVIIAVLVYLIYTEWSKKEGFLMTTPQIVGSMPFKTPKPTTQATVSKTTRVPKRVPTMTQATISKMTRVPKRVPTTTQATVNPQMTVVPIPTPTPTMQAMAMFIPTTTPHK